MSLDSFSSCYGCCLEHTKSLYFKGNSTFLIICHPTLTLQWLLFLCTQSALSTEGSVARAYAWLGHQLPDCWGMLVPYKPDVENEKEYLRLLQLNPNVFLHILTLQGLFMIHLLFHCKGSFYHDILFLKAAWSYLILCTHSQTEYSGQSQCFQLYSVTRRTDSYRTYEN